MAAVLEPAAGASEGRADATPEGTEVAGAGYPIAIGRGLLAGIAFGALYRWFMRLVATSPEFTWEGTALIVGSVTIVALVASLTAMGRVRLRSRGARGGLRVVGVLVFILLLQAQGMATAPTVLLGGLALGRTSWSRPVRIGMGVLAVAGVALFPVLGAGELAELGVARSVLVMAVYVVILTALLRLFTIPTATPGTQWSAWPGRRPA